MLSIPHHALNKHDNCGSWCRHSDQNSRKQTVLLKNQHLYTALKDIFGKNAKNSQKLCVSASSHANESINNIMAHKAPKNICYSRSESVDYRYASAICTKNIEDSHVVNVNKKLQLSPEKFTESFTQQLDETRGKENFVTACLCSKKYFTERTGERAFKLESLARDFLKESNGASSYLHSEDIFSRAKSFGDSINHIMNLQQMNAVLLPFLKPLKTILIDGMLRKMAKEGLTYETIQKKYDEKGEE
ncbi:hypothetical protein PV325_009018, partial [Microctonus aethiopoides]